MSKLGTQLKDARENRNLTVQQVSALTNIKTEHIRALEEGNYAFFSAPIYIRGFVRSIAIALKLDLTETMTQLDIELDNQKVNLKNADLQKPRQSQKIENSNISEPAEDQETQAAIPWKILGSVGLAFAVLACGFLVLKNLPDSGKSEQDPKPSLNLIKRNYQESLELPSTNAVADSPQ